VGDTLHRREQRECRMSLMLSFDLDWSSMSTVRAYMYQNRLGSLNTAPTHVVYVSYNNVSYRGPIYSNDNPLRVYDSYTGWYKNGWLGKHPRAIWTSNQPKSYPAVIDRKIALSGPVVRTECIAMRTPCTSAHRRATASKGHH